MSVSGSGTPAFSATIAGSFHFVILPSVMLASTGPVNFSSCLTPGDVVDGDDGAEHGGQVQDLARARPSSGRASSGASVAPKKTVRLRELLDAAAGAAATGS